MKIGIVNDSAFASNAIASTLASKGGHEVIWKAESGADAIRLCSENRPDLVLMDLIMPGLNGAETTRRIMASHPVAILVVTASVGRNCALAFEAMGAGALDAIETPTLDNERGQRAFLDKISQIAAIVSDRPRPAVPPPCQPETLACGQPGTARRIVAIGCSAGGPAALATILSGLPESFPAAMVIIQHIDEKFVRDLADWLRGQSPAPLHLAAEGEALMPGNIYLAGAIGHAEAHACGRLRYIHDTLDLAYQPSVDVFLSSVARVWRGDAMGVVLTGMGRDGAVGLRQMRTRGFLTIAQDEATSALYGMPKACAENEAAREILPLDLIPARIIRWLETTR